MKKNLLFTLICVFTISFSHAQFEVGQKILVGGISFGSQKNTNNDSMNYGWTSASNSYFSLSASYGKFKKPNLVTGFGFSFSSNTSKYQYPSGTSNNNSNYQSIGASYFGTRYKSLGKGFLIFLNFKEEFQFNFGKNEAYINDKIIGTTIATTINPGFSYRLNDRFLINASLNNLFYMYVSRSKETYQNSAGINKENEQNNFIFSSSLTNGSLSSIGLGFTYLIHK